MPAALATAPIQFGATGFANVFAQCDAAENDKFTKARARGRIDGAVAAAMAIGRILAGDEGPSIYEAGDGPEGFLWV